MKLLFGGALLFLAAAAKPRTTTPKPQPVDPSYVSPLKHDISIVTARNFELSISKSRDRFPAALMFYRKTPAAKEFIDTVWDAVAKELKGMIKVGAVDCQENLQFCAQQDAKDIDNYLIRVYPTLPMPPYLYQGKAEKPKLANQLAKLIPDAKVTNITDELTLQNFLGNFPALPKVLLFTDKPKPSRLFNALGNTFSDRMLFAMVYGTLEDPIAKRFRVKKMPTLLLKKGDLTPTLKGSSMYKGDLNFRDIHEWLNVHSETFVKGGGFITENEPDPKNMTDLRPWLTQRIPELTKGSHNDVCFKKPKGLCVTYLKWGESLTEEEVSMLERLAEQFRMSAKPELHWSWMNMEIEANYAKLFKMQSEDQKTPSLAVFNPHSRLRFSKMPSETEATESNINAFVEKIISGDGRFTVIKGNKVPAFTVRSKKSKKEEGKEEL
eukprot:Gregarina_sp_Pseudo_9__1021@NODE_165_length_3881_cov_45_211869_g152_i0_p2_GENE_NODE_165_length_3881_cov_45_211869_g152_i0NODE_165_length_3881_cov_45_211869_g152_i0_p2_ORF_typecomplete_len438_score101_52Thioredoxin_6/PF13848_6/0_59Thioredoxin_6/PF13848_6/3_2e10Thioredoxin/PF00085_20/3e05Thioredoxin/PF00085_20/0_012Thioredoxin/PF00085_20/4_9e02HyaE/PF07449_11/3_8e03HyaE/PF07449_11/0_0022HyaE/PF07449_11/1_3e02_NODE_165_length_3881_cov_45_211869_g152_i024363749